MAASSMSYNDEKSTSSVFEEEPESGGVAAFFASHFKK